MPNVAEFYSGSGSTLKPDDIDDEKKYVIVSWRHKAWDDGTKTLYLKLDGEDKELRVNKTNARRIVEMYGPEIDDWIGKPLSLFQDLVNTPSGKTVPSILVRISKTARNAPKGKPVYNETNPPPFDDEVPF